MRKEKMNYGNIVCLEPVIYTDAYVFIPKLFAWEKESVSAEIIVGDYRIQCNLDTKLSRHILTVGHAACSGIPRFY